MDSLDIDFWDVLAPPDNEQTGIDLLKDTNPFIDLRQSETFSNSSVGSPMSSSSGGSPAATQDPIITHDLVQVEDILPFLEITIPEAYFDSLLEDEKKEDGPSEVTKTTKTPKDPKHKKKNSKLTKSEKEKAKKSLPPCNVCGAKSSGFHFGVITCESCKVFFRRNVAKEKSLICHRKENCEILPGDRSNCPFCRLKKCHEVGMSKDGIKMGRHSKQRKQDYQDLFEEHKNKEQQKQDDEQRLKEENLRKIKATIERLKNLHDRHRLLTPEVLENVRIAQHKKKEYVKAMEEAVGETSQISPDDAMEFYRTTGVDITGYKEVAIKCFQSCPQRYCAAIIEYLKEMDEYMSLNLKDRVAVLKGGFDEWAWLSQNEVVINPEFMRTCIFCGACYLPEQLALFMTKEEVLAILKPAVILDDLKLSDLEIAILRAFVFFDTSKCQELEEPEKVNLIQNHFLECVLYVLEENRGASKAVKTFGSIIHAFTELRNLKEFRNKLTEKFVEVFSGELKCPKAIGEMFDLPDAVVELETDFSNLQLQT